MIGKITSFEDFCNYFNNENDCIKALFEAKWPNGFRCPRCAHTIAHLISTRRLPLYECKSCHKQTSLIVGTVMEGSRTPLHLWFQALYLHTQLRGINALQLSKIIDVTYKTAWLICHKIRHVMSHSESHNLLSGIVRISDAVYSKQLKTCFEWHKHEQSLLIGSAETQSGEITCIKIKKQPKKPIVSRFEIPNATLFLLENVCPSSASRAIITNRLGRGSNKALVQKGHEVTRWLAWTFRGIGPKHLQAYLDQFCYILNQQQAALPMFVKLLTECAAIPTINYLVLTGSSPVERSLRRTRRHSSQQSQNAS